MQWGTVTQDRIAQLTMFERTSNSVLTKSKSMKIQTQISYFTELAPMMSQFKISMRILTSISIPTTTCFAKRSTRLCFEIKFHFFVYVFFLLFFFRQIWDYNIGDHIIEIVAFETSSPFQWIFNF